MGSRELGLDTSSLRLFPGISVSAEIDVPFLGDARLFEALAFVKVEFFIPPDGPRLSLSLRQPRVFLK